ncbi:tetratricopeptide repeat protein [Candidatus Poribacteria bacterium]|nr:tetratricopeptide repeat protein [Candidatus Poribacteria bacterium]
MAQQIATITNRRGSFLRILAVALLPALVYANTLGNSFQYDDPHFILNNQYVHSLAGIGHFFISPRLIGNIPLSGYRPLTMATFVLNYVAGGQDPLGYHLVNIAIHVLNTLLVYAAAGALMRSFGIEQSHTAALAVALLFACHPINTQPVNYISGRSTLLAGGFSLLCFLLYTRAREPAAFHSEPLIRGHDVPPQAGCPRIKGNSRRFVASGAKNLRKTLFLLASLVAYLCALLSKEEAVAVPGLLALYEILRFRLQFDKKRLLQTAIALAPFVALTAGFMVFVVRILRVIGDTQQARGLWENLFVQAKALFIYFRLIALPTNLSIDHVVTTSGSLLAPAALASVVAAVALFAGSLLLIRSLPIVTFGLWWFALALAPSSTLVALKLVVNEQRMYLPTVGIMFIAGYVLGVGLDRNSTGGRKKWRKALICGFSAVLIVLSALTVNRNTQWRDPLSLWTSALEEYPESARANTQVANIYLATGRLEDALEAAKRAVKAAPDTPETRIALANAYTRSGFQQEALIEARAAVSLNAGSPDAQTTLGVIYARLGRYDEAEAAWVRALELDPQNAEAKENIEKLRAAQSEGESNQTGRKSAW